jgi:hypothetical protein
MGVWPEAGPQSEPVLAVERPEIGLSHAMSLLSTQRFGQGTKNLGKSLVGTSAGCNTLACHGLRRHLMTAMGGSRRGNPLAGRPSWTGWEAAKGPHGNPQGAASGQRGPCAGASPR